MNDVAGILKHLRDNLCLSIEVGGLLSRNATAHKWKAPWRSLMLREAVAWRTIDLLSQSLTLQASDGILGARILLRSAYETLALLVYLNQAMRSVVAGDLDFHRFSETTTKLVLGSRDKSTPYDSINILTILSKADKRYPGLESSYIALSESAHPNYEGMVRGYSTADQTSHVTTFSSRWSEQYGKYHPAHISACISVFCSEYDDEWPDAFTALESWIEANDIALETSKPTTGSA